MGNHIKDGNQGEQGQRGLWRSNKEDGNQRSLRIKFKGGEKQDELWIFYLIILEEAIIELSERESATLYNQVKLMFAFFKKLN